MKQVNIIVKSSVQEQEKFIGTYPEKNLLTIDAEGQIIQDDVTTHGIKIGDGETKWDDLPFLKLPPDIANDWKVLAESATNGQLVTLPDLNFAYLLIDAEKLDNAQYTEIVNQIASRNIGLYPRQNQENHYTLMEAKFKTMLLQSTQMKINPS